MLAFYLPQFHPTPENDCWWGKGFTEWTNVARARPLYPGHFQPRLPQELGFYDLRVAETRQAQAELAARHGVEAFCYWHYWFAGRRMLERPFEEVLSTGKPDFPFCLAWANETWSGVWHGAEDHILIEQTYPGEHDHRKHFEYLLRAFRDERYVKVDGKPLFAIYQPRSLPDARRTLDLWRNLAHQAGLPGLHLVALVDHWELPYPVRELGFDAVCYSNQLTVRACFHDPHLRREFRRSLHSRRDDNGHVGAALQDGSRSWMSRSRAWAGRLRGYPERFAYLDARRYFLSPFEYGVPSYPSIIPGWDNTPRSRQRGVVLEDATPEFFGEHVREVLDHVAAVPWETRIVFIKSWNEWAEGNYMEPDLRYGDAFLRTLRDELHRP